MVIENPNNTTNDGSDVNIGNMVSNLVNSLTGSLNGVLDPSQINSNIIQSPPPPSPPTQQQQQQQQQTPPSNLNNNQPNTSYTFQPGRPREVPRRVNRPNTDFSQIFDVLGNAERRMNTLNNALREGDTNAESQNEV